MNNSLHLSSDSDTSGLSTNQATFNTTAIGKDTFTTLDDGDDESDQDCFIVSSTSISSPMISNRSTDASIEPQSIILPASKLTLQSKLFVCDLETSSSSCDSDNQTSCRKSPTHILSTNDPQYNSDIGCANKQESSTQEYSSNILTSSSSSFDLETSSSCKSLGTSSSIPRTATDAQIDNISEMVSSDENTESNGQESVIVPTAMRRNNRLKSLIDQMEHSSEGEPAEHQPVTPSKQRMCRVALARLNLSPDSVNTNERQAKNESSPNKHARKSTHQNVLSTSDTGNSPGPSPRKLRLRTPSTKCLEGFNLQDLHLSPTTPERRISARKSIKSKRYTEHFAELEKRRQLYTSHRTQPNEKNQGHEEEEDEIMEDVEMLKKSTILYDHDADVAGQNLFSFRTPKKRDGMAILAASAPPKTPQTPKISLRKSKTARTPGTPKNTKSMLATTSKTPRSCRLKMKKQLAQVTKQDSSGSDFSGSDSDDYQPNEKPTSSDSDNDLDGSNDSTQSDDIRKKTVKPIMSIASQTPGRPMTRARKQQDFVPESEGYFSHHVNKKATTSDRTLDHLRTPRLPHDHLFRLLSTMTLSIEHENAITNMVQDYRQSFPKWLFILNEGFNILLHGLGSKRTLLQAFHQIMLSDETVLVVNGFFPSLTIKDILDNISNDILDLTVVSRNVHEIVDAIEEELSGQSDQRIFLIIHNIDGTMLRNHKAQLVLSRLAKIKQIHLIASMDHINAPLLWDHTKLSNFNFSWWDTTTLLPYTEETAFENSMLVHNSGGLVLSSMKNVLVSLTDNSRGIYLIIVKNQISHKGNSNFQGMPFKDLYSRCREDFLVSSDVALRSQLTEFIDHNLLKMKRTVDGTEHLIIPLDTGLLQKFIEEQENSD